MADERRKYKPRHRRSTLDQPLQLKTQQSQIAQSTGGGVSTVAQQKKKTNVFIFDFDETLTDRDIHSGGKPGQNFKMMRNEQNLDQLKTMLHKLKDAGIPVYICTRAVENLVEQALKKNLGEDIIGKRGPIVKVYGAKDINQVREGGIYWTNRKKDIIQNILQKENIEAKNAYFFDDDNRNCEQARTIKGLNVIHNAEGFSTKPNGTRQKVYETGLIAQEKQPSSMMYRQPRSATGVSRRQSSSSPPPQQRNRSPRTPTPVALYTGGGILAGIAAVAILFFAIRK